MTNLDYTTIGKKIKDRRHVMGFTQEYLANILDVNPSHISNIERGRSNPSLTILVKIANILECSVDCFIGSEYTYDADKNDKFDAVVMDQLSRYDSEKKIKLIKVMEII